MEAISRQNSCIGIMHSERKEGNLSDVTGQTRPRTQAFMDSQAPVRGNRTRAAFGKERIALIVKRKCEGIVGGTNSLPSKLIGLCICLIST